MNNIRIHNPLTILGIFAAIAEAGFQAASVFVDRELQEILVYGSLAFAFTLVLLFFLVLWFKHEVLYAPSDFRSDEEFNKNILIRRKESEKRRQDIADHGAETQQNAPTTDHETVGSANPSSGDEVQHAAQNRVVRHEIHLGRNLRNAAEAALVERRVIEEIEENLDIRLERDVSFSKDGYIFDAVGIAGKSVVLIEVKSIRAARQQRAAWVRRIIDAAFLASQRAGKVKVLICITAPEDTSTEEINLTSHKLNLSFGGIINGLRPHISIEVRFYTVSNDMIIRRIEVAD